MKKALMAFAGLMILAAVFTWVRMRTADTSFPYGHSSAEIQIRLQEGHNAVDHRVVYELKAGDIEGEAFVISTPSAAEGNTLVETQAFGVKSSFQERPAPYAGQITAAIACDSQKYVKEEAFPFAGRSARLISAVASGRKIYGSCSADEIKHASVFLAGFDESRNQALTIKLFRPVASVNEVSAAQEAMKNILAKLLQGPNAE